MATSTISSTHGNGDRFYVWMAGICLVVPLLAFAPTYYLQLPAGTVVGTRGLHLHALIFTVWPMFFALQTWFAVTGRVRSHRAWGIAGVSLGTVLILSGLTSAIRQLDANLSAGYGDGATAFAIVPMSQMMLFAGTFAAALVKRGQPAFHKRLMLMATIALLPAALVRIPFALLVGFGPGLRPGNGVAPPPVAFPAVVALLADLLIVAAMLYDWRRHGKPHRAYVIGGALFFMAHLLVAPLSSTSAWRAVADFLRGFA